MAQRTIASRRGYAPRALLRPRAPLPAPCPPPLHVLSPTFDPHAHHSAPRPGGGWSPCAVRHPQRGLVPPPLDACRCRAHAVACAALLYATRPSSAPGATASLPKPSAPGASDPCAPAPSILRALPQRPGDAPAAPPIESSVDQRNVALRRPASLPAECRSWDVGLVCRVHAACARSPPLPATLPLVKHFQGTALAPISHHRAPLLLLPSSPALLCATVLFSASSPGASPDSRRPSPSRRDRSRVLPHSGAGLNPVGPRSVENTGDGSYAAMLRRRGFQKSIKPRTCTSLPRCHWPLPSTAPGRRASSSR